jgi:hypothetical protein
MSLNPYARSPDILSCHAPGFLPSFKPIFYVHLFWQSHIGACLLKKQQQQQQQQSPPVVTLDFFASHSHSLDLAPLLPRTSSQSTPQFYNAPGFVPLTVETFGRLCNPFMDLHTEVTSWSTQHSIANFHLRAFVSGVLRELSIWLYGGLWLIRSPFPLSFRPD